MVGGRSEGGSRRSTRAASVVVSFPRSTPGARLDLARFVPSGRSLLVSFGIVVAGAAAYWIAVASPLFAVDRVEVRGAPPEVEREVLAATREYLGTSLVAVNADQVEAKVSVLPSVAAVTVDRAFPSTIAVRVAPQRPIAVARRGHLSWLVAPSGEVIRKVETGSERTLPRLWLQRTVDVRPVGVLPTAFAPSVRALAAADRVRFLRRIRGVRRESNELTLVLRRGVEFRLGLATDLALKITVAAKVLPRVGRPITYVDVSVPERPVAGYESQPSG